VLQTDANPLSELRRSESLGRPAGLIAPALSPRSVWMKTLQGAPDGLREPAGMADVRRRPARYERGFTSAIQPNWNAAGSRARSGGPQVYVTTATATAGPLICSETGRYRCGNPCRGALEAERSKTRKNRLPLGRNHWAESQNSFSKKSLFLRRQALAALKRLKLQRGKDEAPARLSALSAPIQRSAAISLLGKRTKLAINFRAEKTKTKKRLIKDDLI